jgi:hypothetical protein
MIGGTFIWESKISAKNRPKFPSCEKKMLDRIRW